MSDVRYRCVPRPWSAAIATTAPGPRLYFGKLVAEAARNGLPARGPLPHAAGLVARTTVRLRPVAAAVALVPARPRPDVDAVLADVRHAWQRLTGVAGHLPGSCPQLHGLALQRRAGLTVFVFGEGPEPLLVAKVGGDRVAIEAAALREAEPARIAPRALGAAGSAQIQEVITGAPLRVSAIAPSNAARSRVSAELGSLGEALIRLAEVSGKRAAPVSRARELARAAACDDLDARARSLVTAAAADVARLERAVLWHRDTSPQNCLCANGRLAGLVDWELAETFGIPGWDLLNAALSAFEGGVGLHNFSGKAVRNGFAAAWHSAPLFAWARRTYRQAAVAAGVPDHALDGLELAFYAVRLAHRLNDPKSWATDAATAAHMVRVVAESG